MNGITDQTSTRCVTIIIFLDVKHLYEALMYVCMYASIFWSKTNFAHMKSSGLMSNLSKDPQKNLSTDPQKNLSKHFPKISQNIFKK